MSDEVPGGSCVCGATLGTVPAGAGVDSEGCGDGHRPELAMHLYAVCGVSFTF